MASYNVTVTIPPVTVVATIKADRPPTEDELLQALYVDAKFVNRALPKGMRLAGRSDWDTCGQYEVDATPTGPKGKRGTEVTA